MIKSIILLISSLLFIQSLSYSYFTYKHQATRKDVKEFLNQLATQKALNHKNKISRLLEEILYESIQTNAEFNSIKKFIKYKRSPEVLISKIFQKRTICYNKYKPNNPELWYKYNINCKKDVCEKTGEDYFIIILKNLIKDLDSLQEKYDIMYPRIHLMNFTLRVYDYLLVFVKI